MKTLMLFFLLNSLFSLATDQKDLKSGILETLSILSTDYFATDPRRLNECARSLPEFARSKYYKCVKDGFDSHPDLGKKPSFWAVLIFKYGLSRSVTNHASYTDAIVIQAKCLQKIGSTGNSK